MTERASVSWTGPSDDPNDEHLGDVIEPVSLSAAERLDVVLVGEPYDDGAISRKGAREGPDTIREALARTKTHHVDAGPIGNIGDLGDLSALAELTGGVPGAPMRRTTSIRSIQSAVRGETARIHGLDALPIFLGGDNSLTYPNAAPLLDRGSLGCITLDAHLDVREVRREPTSGTPYRQLFEEGLDAYACLGARHFETSTAYHEFVDERGGEVVTAEAVGEDPVEAARRAVEAMGDVDAVYLSLDLDVLDATAAPGVSAPTPGGLTTRELFVLLRTIATDDRVAGFEVVECAPQHDRDDRTSEAAARAIAHFLAGWRGSDS